VPKLFSPEPENNIVSSIQKKQYSNIIYFLHFLNFSVFAVLVTFLNIYYRDNGLNGFLIGVLDPKGSLFYR
jgi:hypothetical protein